MTVIADENVSHEFITNLRHLGFDVLSIRESHRSSRDQYIIEVVRRYKGVRTWYQGYQCYLPSI